MNSRSRLNLQAGFEGHAHADIIGLSSGQKDSIHVE